MLVARTVTNLNDIQDITLHAGLGYANLVEFPLNPDPQRRAELLQAMAATRAANDKTIDDLRRRVTDPEIRSGLDGVIARRAVCRQAGDAFITSCQRGDSAEVEAASSRRLLLAFDDYQKSCDKLGDLIQANSIQTGAQVSAQIRRLRLLFFGLAILPLAVAFILVLLTLWLFWGTPVEADLRDANSRGDFMPRTQADAAVVEPGIEPAGPKGKAEGHDRPA